MSPGAHRDRPSFPPSGCQPFTDHISFCQTFQSAHGVPSTSVSREMELQAEGVGREMGGPSTFPGAGCWGSFCGWNFQSDTFVNIMTQLGAITGVHACIACNHW